MSSISRKKRRCRKTPPRHSSRDKDTGIGISEWSAAKVEIIVPMLWGYEVDSALRHRVWRGAMPSVEANEARESLLTVPIAVKDSLRVRRRAWGIAERATSIYAALAEDEPCDLWTADENFFKAVRGFLPFVKLLGHYEPPEKDEPEARQQESRQ